jgi:taspase (threonine aspartase 1)
VKNSFCEAAIGVMAVKKMKDGIYLFFCHNTDSFVSDILIIEKMFVIDGNSRHYHP